MFRVWVFREKVLWGFGAQVFRVQVFRVQVFLGVEGSGV